MQLIKEGKAYVDDLTAEQIREHRGTPDRAGQGQPVPQPRRSRRTSTCSARMRAGEFPDGARTLRAKIDMASPNLNLRDPVMYRILHASTTAPATSGASTRCTTGRTASRDSHRGRSRTRSARWSSRTTGRSTTGSSTQLGIYHPQQIEFARLNLTYTVLSKRKLLQLVQERHVRGWDDPRMPTIAGLRRRGYTPEAIREFCERIGVTKSDSIVDMLLEDCLREDLNKRAARGWPCCGR